MISVVIPTLDAEATLGDALTALIPAVVEGVVREVIIVDGGSTDRTLRIADAVGRDDRRGSGRAWWLSCAPGAAAARNPGCCSCTPTPFSNRLGRERPGS